MTGRPLFDALDDALDVLGPGQNAREDGVALEDNGGFRTAKAATRTPSGARTRQPSESSKVWAPTSPSPEAAMASPAPISDQVKWTASTLAKRVFSVTA